MGGYENHRPPPGPGVRQMVYSYEVGKGVLMDKGPEIRVFKTDMRFKQLSVFIEQTSGQHYALAEPVVMKIQTNEELTCPLQPTTTLSPTAAQQLIDDLWDCGLRPSEGSGSAGAMAATERHLKDMRTLVFKGKE